jgi:hypothetical protein
MIKLQGSEKQIALATKISKEKTNIMQAGYDNAFKQAEQKGMSAEKIQQGKETAKVFMDWLESHVYAGWWIEHKENTPQQLMAAKKVEVKGYGIEYYLNKR